MKNVTNDNFKRAEAELLKAAEAKANYVEPTPAIPEIQEVEANLGDFSLTDNGTYLSVSHKVLHDATIGIVSKNEYEKGNKQALLTSVLQNKFAEYVSMHSLRITGSFVEPTINPAPKEEVIKVANWQDHLQNVYSGNMEEFLDYDAQYRLHERLGFATAQEAWEANPVVQGSTNPADYKVVPEDKAFEPAKEITSDLPLLRSADSFRQNVETVAARNQDKLNRFVDSATNGLVSHLQGLHYDMPKVIEVDASNLSENITDQFNGFITASVSLENSTGPKYLNLPITISASKVVYPNEKETANFVSKGIDLRTRLEEKLALEALTAMAKVDAEEAYKVEEVYQIISERTNEIEKIATDNGLGGTQFFGPQDEITVGKYLLPVEVEVGDKLFFDGANWECINIDSEQLSKGEGDGSLLKFRKCAPPADDGKEPKAVVSR